MADSVTVVASSKHTQTRSAALLATTPTTSGHIEALLSSVEIVWESEDIGLVVDVLGSSPTAFGAVGISLYGSVLAQEIKKHLPEHIILAATDEDTSTNFSLSLICKSHTVFCPLVPEMTLEILGVVASVVNAAYSKLFTVFCALRYLVGLVS
jgi:hypothetical protein